MGTWELFLIAVGLSMDAFAVAICKGLSVKRLKLKHALLTGLYFGLFQALDCFCSAVSYRCKHDPRSLQQRG